jgi:O-antigen ligase
VALVALLVSRRISFGNVTGALAWTAGSFAGLALLTAVSSSWAGDDAAAFAELNRWLMYLGVVVLVALASRRGTFSAWLAGIAIGGVAVALVSLSSRLLGFGGDAELAQQLPLAAERLSYPLGYWNGLGYLMAMVATSLFWFAGTARDRGAGLAVAATIPVVAVIFLTSSRGAVLTLLIGAICVAWLMPERARLLAAAIVALPAWLVAVVAVAARRDHLEPPADPGLWGIALALGIAGLAVLAVLAFPLIARRELDPARLRRVVPVAAVAGAIALLAAVAVIGPGSFFGDFRGQTVSGDGGAASGLASGSDRSAYWGTALEAFADDPLRGIGSGGYENYWNEHGAIGTPVQNAHSAPIESLGELGILGGALFLALLLAPLLIVRRRLSDADDEIRSRLGPVLGILVVGLFAVAIDWTWDLPAAIAPFLICVGLVSGRCLVRPEAPHGSEIADARLAGYERSELPARPAPAWLGLGAFGVGAVAIWCGTVLALASIQLGLAAERLEEGDLDGAARAARSAAQLEPWSAEPSLRLAEIELTGANYESARRRAEEAVRASPQDFRSWLLLSQIQRVLGNDGATGAYLTRAVALAPYVLARIDAG